MYERQQIVCLRTVPYSDSSAILWGYSRQMGRASFQVPAGHGREARRRRALTMPMSMVECMVNVVPGRSIYTMRDVMPWGAPSPAVEGDPVKIAIGVFLADLSGSRLRERPPVVTAADLLNVYHSRKFSDFFARNEIYL